MPDTFTPTDTLANVRALAPELSARAAEMEEVRRLPADLAAKMAKAGLFRMVTPKSFGGLELTPREIVEAVEAVATANAIATAFPGAGSGARARPIAPGSAAAARCGKMVR